MEVALIRCSNCFAPVDPGLGATQRCRYCGAILSLSGDPPDGGLRLLEVGPHLIQVIRVVREHTGLGLKDAKDLVESAPCTLVESLDGHRLARFRAELEEVGARVSGGGGTTAPVPPPPQGAVMLEHCGANKIAVIKVIREHTGLGLKEAKELADSAPCAIEPRKPSRTSLRDDLVAAGARVR